jgi:hypothetical protein
MTAEKQRWLSDSQVHLGIIPKPPEKIHRTLREGISINQTKKNFEKNQKQVKKLLN